MVCESGSFAREPLHYFSRGIGRSSTPWGEDGSSTAQYHLRALHSESATLVTFYFRLPPFWPLSEFQWRLRRRYVRIVAASSPALEDTPSVARDCVSGCRESAPSLLSPRQNVRTGYNTERGNFFEDLRLDSILVGRVKVNLPWWLKTSLTSENCSLILIWPTQQQTNR